MELSRRDLVAGAASLAVLPRSASACVDLDPAAPYGGAYFGCSVGGYGLGNTRFTTYHSHRFRAEMAGEVASLKFMQPRKTGYFSGNGGKVQFHICADNNGNPNPDSKLGSSVIYAKPLELGDFPLVPFETKPVLTFGTVFHVLYQQFEPANGTISVDDIWSMAKVTPRSAWPFQADTLASIMNDRGTWRIRPEATPIFELTYSNGVTKGQGYGMGGGQDARNIQGKEMARQTFLLAKPSHVDQATVRLWRKNTNSGDLTVRIKVGTTVLAETSIPCDAVVESGEAGGKPPIGWINVSFPRTEINANLVHTLELSAPADAGFVIAGTYKGLSEGFKDDKMKRGVRGEYSTDGGSTWTGWSLWGVNNRQDVDLPILFRHA